MKPIHVLIITYECQITFKYSYHNDYSSIFLTFCVRNSCILFHNNHWLFNNSAWSFFILPSFHFLFFVFLNWWIAMCSRLTEKYTKQICINNEIFVKINHILEEYNLKNTNTTEESEWHGILRILVILWWVQWEFSSSLMGPKLSLRRTN